MVSRIEITATSATYTKGGGAYDCIQIGVGAITSLCSKICTAGRGFHAQKFIFKRGITPLIQTNSKIMEDYL